MARVKNLDIFIYLRKSRKDLEEEKKAVVEGKSYDTLERHRRRLFEVVKNENHNVIEVFEEVASGEYIIERPEIQRMLREIEGGAVDAVLVVDLDRLGRGDMFDMGAIFRALQYSETIVITPTDILDPNAEGAELVFGVKSIISREELKAINKRLQSGRRDSAKEGKSISKKPPYGYLRDNKLKLYPDPEKAWVVQKIFQMVIDGHGRTNIANELMKLGIKSPDDKEVWSVSTVSAIIKNEVYLGHLIWGKVKYMKRNGKQIRRKVPKDKWIIHENSHEPLVTQEVFEEANEVHSGRFRASTVVSKTLSNPLAGVIKCANCGRSLLYQPRKDRPTNQIRCVNPQCRGIQKGATMEIVEKRVINSLEQIIEGIEVDGKVENKKTSPLPGKKKAFLTKQKELDEIMSQKNNLHDLLEQGVYDINTFMERQKVLAERIQECEKIIVDLQREIDDEESRENQNIHFLPRAREAIQAYKETDCIEEKNRLLKSVVGKISFRRKVDWKKKDEFELEIYPKI